MKKYIQYNTHSNMYYIYETQIMVSKLLLLFIKCTFNDMIIFEQCDAMWCNLLRTCVYDQNVNARCWHTSLICNCSDQSIRPIRRSKCTHWYRFECLMHTYSSQIWARFQSRLSGRLACRQFNIYSSRIGVADSIYYTRSIELCRI